MLLQVITSLLMKSRLFQPKLKIEELNDFTGDNATGNISRYTDEDHLTTKGNGFG